MILHVTRHCQTDTQKADTPGDPPLSDLGRQQAAMLGRRLANLGFRGPIYSSPYYRTIETAHIIAEIVDTTVIPAAAMREYFIREGQLDGFQGATNEELQTTYPRVQINPDFPYPWWTTEIESREMVEARVAPLIDRLTKGNTDALLVGHGASVGGVHDHVFHHNAPDQINHGKRGWNCILSSFQFALVFNVLRIMDTAHLPPEAITANAKTRDEVLREEADKDQPKN